MIVAALVNQDGSYFLTEMFFFLMSTTGILITLWVHFHDTYYLNGILDRPTIIKDSQTNGRSNRIVDSSLASDGTHNFRRRTRSATAIDEYEHVLGEDDSSETFELQNI